MRLGIRVIAASVTVAFLFAGPLAPAAVAQQPPAPPAGQPDAFQEAMKTDRADDSGRPLPPPAYGVAAGVATSFLIPGRFITCTLGTGVAAVMLAITLGTGYRTAARLVEEGCGGKWVVGPDDMMPDRQPEPMRGPVTEPR
jgi:hypothetical protein